MCVASFLSFSHDKLSGQVLGTEVVRSCSVYLACFFKYFGQI